MSNKRLILSTLVSALAMGSVHGQVWVYNKTEAPVELRTKTHTIVVEQNQKSRLLGENGYASGQAFVNGKPSASFQLEVPSVALISDQDASIQLHSLNWPLAHDLGKWPARPKHRKTKTIHLNVLSDGSDMVSEDRISGRINWLNDVFAPHAIQFQVDRLALTTAKSRAVVERDHAKLVTGQTRIVVFADSFPDDDCPLGKYIWVDVRRCRTEQHFRHATLRSLVRWFGGLFVPDTSSAMAIETGNYPLDLDIVNRFLIELAAAEYTANQRFSDLPSHVKDRMLAVYKQHLAAFPDDQVCHQSMMHLSPDNYLNEIAEGLALRIKDVSLSHDEFLQVWSTLYPSKGEVPWLELPWELDISVARDRAAREDKPLFIWSAADGNPCGRC